MTLNASEQTLRLTDPTADQLIESAVELAAELKAQSADTEARTYFSEELHEAFLDARLYDMFIPKRYGGLEVSPSTFVKVILELARGDLAAAWCFTLSASHALMTATMFPQSVQDEVFASGDFRSPATVAPTVTATKADGGWSLAGTVGYCSGVPYSTYYLGQAKVPGENGAPTRMATFVAPRSTFTMLDDWGHALGLRGTGSHSIRFDGGVIRDDYLLMDTEINNFPVENGTPGYALHGNPLYSARTMTMFGLTIGALAVGGAYGALDEYAELMRTKTTPLPPITSRLSDPDYQRWYGSAFVKIGAAKAIIMQGAAELEQLAAKNVTGEHPFTFADDFTLAGYSREAHIMSWEAVEQQLYRTIGSSAVQTGQPFERAYRDLAQAVGHRSAQVRDAAYRMIASMDLEAPGQPVAVSEPIR